MNQNPLDQRLREVISRRPLTEAEQAELDVWLSAHPEARTDWELELALSKTLERDSAPKAPSNFTARIFQEIERGQKISRPGRTTVRGGWWRALEPHDVPRGRQAARLGRRRPRRVRVRAALVSAAW